MNVIKSLFPALTAFNNTSASIYAAFGREGISTWAHAQPTVLAWAATQYSVTVVKGQRGDTLKGRDYEAAKTAVRRIRECFETTTAKPRSSKAADPVAALIKRIEKLSAAQRRRVLAAFA